MIYINCRVDVEYYIIEDDNHIEIFRMKKSVNTLTQVKSYLSHLSGGSDIKVIMDAFSIGSKARLKKGLDVGTVYDYTGLILTQELEEEVFTIKGYHFWDSHTKVYDMTNELVIPEALLEAVED